MTVYEALMLMIAFSTLLVTVIFHILNHTKKK
ncbi:MAG: putative holin-like toxin [Tumebacillaceae bacterium]